MKQIIFISLFFLSCSLQAQYNRFFVPGATWQYYITNSIASLDDQILFLKVASDTLINGNIYEQISITDSSYTSSSPAVFYRIAPNGAFYYRAISDSMEYKIFDFSLAVGDTFRYEYPCFSSIWSKACEGIDTTDQGEIVKYYCIVEQGGWEFCCHMFTLVDKYYAVNRTPLDICYIHPFSQLQTYSALVCYHENGVLKYLDNSGSQLDTLCISPAITAISNIQQDHIKIYPNPSKNSLNITNIGQETLVEMYNATGALLFKQVAHSNIEIDVTNYHNGTYIVIISNAKGEVIKREKMILQH